METNTPLSMQYYLTAATIPCFVRVKNVSRNRFKKQERKKQKQETRNRKRFGVEDDMSVMPQPPTNLMAPPAEQTERPERTLVERRNIPPIDSPETETVEPNIQNGEHRETETLRELSSPTSFVELETANDSQTSAAPPVSTITLSDESNPPTRSACYHCGKNFSSSSHLSRHEREHNGEKTHQCEQCSRAFSQASQLKTHIRSHTGEKPFECNVCNKSYYRAEHLKNHKRNHTGEKPYKCGVCSHEFTEKGSLNKHMQTHSGEKFHHCEVCQQGFSTNGNLQRHTISKHQGPASKPCTICDKPFSRPDLLKRHMKIHTGEMQKCKFCSRIFSMATKFNRIFSQKIQLKKHKCRQE